MEKDKANRTEETEVNTLDLSHTFPGEKDFGEPLIDILNTTNSSEQPAWVSLSDNEFETVVTPSLEKLEDLANIVSLDLSNNKITLLSPGLFHKLGYSLLFLNLSHNALSEVPDGITALSALKELDLSYNAIDAVPPSLAALEPHIEEIKLAGNPLRALPCSDALLLRTEMQCFPLSTYDVLQYAAGLTAPGEWGVGSLVVLGNDSGAQTALVRSVAELDSAGIEGPTALSPVFAARVATGEGPLLSVAHLHTLNVFNMLGEVVDGAAPLARVLSSVPGCVALAVCNCASVAAKKEAQVATAVATLANKVLRPLGAVPRVVLAFTGLPGVAGSGAVDWVNTAVMPLLCTKPHAIVVLENKDSIAILQGALAAAFTEERVDEKEEEGISAWRQGVPGSVCAFSLYVRRRRITSRVTTGKELREWARRCYIEDSDFPRAVDVLWRSGEIFIFSDTNGNALAGKSGSADIDNSVVFLSPGLLVDVVLTLRNALVRKRMDAALRVSDLLTFWRRCEVPVSPGLLHAWERLGIVRCGRKRSKIGKAEKDGEEERKDDKIADAWALLPWADNSTAVNARWPAYVPKSVQHFQRIFRVTAPSEQALPEAFCRAVLLAAELVSSQRAAMGSNSNSGTPGHEGTGVSATFSSITDTAVIWWQDGVRALVTLEKVPGDPSADITLTLRCPESAVGRPKIVALRLRALTTAVVLGVALQSVTTTNGSGDCDGNDGWSGVVLKKVTFVCPHCLAAKNEFFSRTEFSLEAVCSAAALDSDEESGNGGGSEPNRAKSSTILKCNAFSAVPAVKARDVAPDIVAMSASERDAVLSDLTSLASGGGSGCATILSRLTAQFDTAVVSSKTGSDCDDNDEEEDDEEEFYLGLLRAYPVTLDGQLPQRHGMAKVTCATSAGPGEFVAGTADGDVVLWSEAKSAFVGSWRVCCKRGAVTGLAYWGGCLWVATDELHSTGLVRVWSLTHRRCLCTVYAPAFFAGAPPLRSPSLLTVVADAYVCAALPPLDPHGERGMLVAWDVRTFGLSYAVEVGLGGPSCAHYSAEQRMLYVGTRSGCVVGYSTEDAFREVLTLRACAPHPVLAVSEAGGRLWCACGPTGLVRAYGLAEQRFLSTGFSESAAEARIATDLDHRATVLLPRLLCGRFLCGGNAVGRVCLWDTVAMRPHRLHRPLSLHNLAMPVVALLPGAVSDTVWVADASSSLSVLAGPVPLDLTPPPNADAAAILAAPHHWAYALACTGSVGTSEKGAFEIRARLGVFEADNVHDVLSEKPKALSQKPGSGMILPPSLQRGARRAANGGDSEDEGELPACKVFKNFLRFLMVEYLSDQLCVRKICAAGKGDNMLGMLFAGIDQPYRIPDQLAEMPYISRFGDVVDAAGVLTALVAYTYGEFLSKLTEEAAHRLAQSVLEIVARADTADDLPSSTLAEFTLAALFLTKPAREPVTLATVNHRVSWTDTDILQRSGIRVDNGDKFVFPDVQLPENFPFRRGTEFQARALNMVKV